MGSDSDLDAAFIAAVRLGTQAADAMALDDRERGDDVAAWASMMFTNGGELRGFPEPVPRDDASRARVRAAYVDAFIGRMHERFVERAAAEARARGGAAGEDAAGDDIVVAELARELAHDAFEECAERVNDEGAAWADFDEETVANLEEDSWAGEAEPRLRLALKTANVFAARRRFRTIFMNVLSDAIDDEREDDDDVR